MKRVAGAVLVLVVLVVLAGLLVGGFRLHQVLAGAGAHRGPEHSAPYWWLGHTPSSGESVPPAPGAPLPPGATPWPIASGTLPPSP